MRAREFVNDLSSIVQSFVKSPLGQKYQKHDCKTVTRAFVQWAEQNNIPTEVITFAPPSADFIKKYPQFRGKSGQGDGHIMPIVNGNAIDFTVRQFGVNRPFDNPLITPVGNLRSVYGKFGYFTDAPEWFLGGKSYWQGPLSAIPSEIFNQNFGDELLENFYAQDVTESNDDDSKKLKGFHQSLGNAVRGHVSQMQANMAILKAQHPDTWLWEPGDIVYSAETGRTYEIIGPWLDNRGTAKYLYHGNDEEKGTFVADRAHQTLKKISGKQGLSENFADGRNPGRKGLSRRMGIPKKSTLGQLEKIARGSTGERRRMAQWQLNMRRGRNKKK